MINRLFYPYRGLDFITRRYYHLIDYVMVGGFRDHINYKDGWTAQANNLTVNHFNDVVDWPTQLELDNPIICELWQNYIVPRFADEFICYSDTFDLTSKEIGLADDPEIQPGEVLNKLRAVFGSFNNQFITWLRQSETRYAKEIEIYKAIENDLMKTIDATSIVKINDTPQVQGDNLDSDKYASNITTSTSKQEVATPIERLKEVRENIRNAYEAWANEFRKFVLYA